MDIRVTIDDPKAYTRPWDVQLTWRLMPDQELIESICEENRAVTMASTGERLFGGSSEGPPC